MVSMHMVIHATGTTTAEVLSLSLTDLTTVMGTTAEVMPSSSMADLTTVMGTTVEVMSSMADLTTIMGTGTTELADLTTVTGSITRHLTIAKQVMKSGEQAGHKKRKRGAATMRTRAVSEAPAFFVNDRGRFQR